MTYECNAWETTRDGRLVPTTELRDERFREIDAMLAAEPKLKRWPRMANICITPNCSHMVRKTGLCQRCERLQRSTASPVASIPKEAE